MGEVEGSVLGKREVGSAHVRIREQEVQKSGGERHKGMREAEEVEQ
jgi:hypothetical protein